MVAVVFFKSMFFKNMYFYNIFFNMFFTTCFSTTCFSKTKTLIHYDPVWSSLIQFGQVWSSLIKFGQVWSSLVEFDQVWSCVIKCFVKMFFQHVSSTCFVKILQTWKSNNNNIAMYRTAMACARSQKCGYNGQLIF